MGATPIEALLTDRDVETLELIGELNLIAVEAAAEGIPIGRTDAYAEAKTPEVRAALFFAFQAAQANGIAPCPF